MGYLKSKITERINEKYFKRLGDNDIEDIQGLLAERKQIVALLDTIVINFNDIDEIIKTCDDTLIDKFHDLILTLIEAKWGIY